MTRIKPFILLVVLLFVAAPARALVDAGWIYTVELPVAAQSQEERARAAEEGLLIVLGRVSGLQSVPRRDVVKTALETPERYYNQFVFFDKREPGGPRQPHVRITFEAQEVIALARSAELPIWWTQRPQVMAWIALAGDGPRRIIGEEEGGALIAAMEAEARRRGIPLTLPKLDLTPPQESEDDDGETAADDAERQDGADETSEVSPSNPLMASLFIEPTPISSGDVWRRDEDVLHIATAERQGELYVAARLTVDQGDYAATLDGTDTGAVDEVRVSGDWRLWLDGAELTERFNDVSLSEAANIGVSLVASALAETFAVLPRARQALSLSIDGVDDIARYASLMRYLQTLEYLERVQVTGMQSKTLSVGVSTRAEVGQLFMLLNAGERLVEPEVAEALDEAAERRADALLGSDGIVVEAVDDLGANEPTDLFDLSPSSPRHLDDALHLVWRG